MKSVMDIFSELERNLSLESAQDTEIVKNVLSSLPPSMALTVCYKAFRRHSPEYPKAYNAINSISKSLTGKRTWMSPAGKEQDIPIRSRSLRLHLLYYIYGSRDRFSDSSYIRLPTASKRALVNDLLKGCRSKYPWLTSKIIHAFAFNSDYFLKHPSKQWGPLYRKISINKGANQKRILHIPSRPLRYLQKRLLLTVLKPAMEVLPECVVGCVGGRRVNKSIFENARKHVGQNFIVNFDLKNFFDTVRLNHIIPVLRGLKKPLLEEKGFRWTEDAALLTAKLTTFRGRLPQGAPTSPAIANLAFYFYDKKILDAIGDRIVYTRYVDDLTFSISRQSARELKFASPQDFKTHIQTTLERILNNSGFAINNRKTKAGRIEDGQAVTGLRVLPSTVDLPRRLKRSIRTSLYQLEKMGFVEYAQNDLGSQFNSNVSVKSLKEYQYCHIRQGDRLSVEKLAILMLRKMGSDLNIEIPRTIEQQEQNIPIKSQEAWKDLEWILTGLWRSALRATRNEDGIRIYDGENILRRIVLGDNTEAFLLLSKQQAINCAFRWHQLRGLLAYLSIKSTDPCFAPIVQWKNFLKDAIGNIQIIARQKQSQPIMINESIPVGDKERVDKLSNDLYDLIDEYRKCLNAVKITEEFKSHATVLQRPKETPESLKYWLTALRYLCFENVEYLPLGDKHNPKNKKDIDGNIIFEHIRIFSERLEGKRSFGYKIEEEYFRRNDKLYKTINTVANIEGPKHILHIYEFFLETVKPLYQQAITRKGKLESSEEWKNSLLINEWSGSIKDRLDRKWDLFSMVHSRCVSKQGNLSIFKEETESKKLKEFSNNLKYDASLTNEQVRKNLFDFGKFLVEITTESIDRNGILKNEADPINNQTEEKGDPFVKLFIKRIKEKGLYKPFDIIYKLRCRASHPEEREKRREWKYIQDYFANKLNRRRPKHKKEDESFYCPDDLSLTPYEGAELKIILLSELSEGLKRILA